MDRLEDVLLRAAGSPLVFVLVAVVLAVGVIVIFLPSESLVVAAAALLLARADRDLRVPLLVVAAAVGLAAGDVLLFALARAVAARRSGGGHSSPLLEAFRRRTAKRVSNVRDRFTQHPWTTMIFMRLVPVGRASSDLVAADVGVPLRRFTAYALVGGLVYGIYCVAIAALAYPLVQKYPVESMIGVIVLAVVLSSVVDRLDQSIQRRRAAHRQQRGAA